jgi:hypothetical protein
MTKRSSPNIVSFRPTASQRGDGRREAKTQAETPLELLSAARSIPPRLMYAMHDLIRYCGRSEGSKRPLSGHGLDTEAALKMQELELGTVAEQPGAPGLLQFQMSETHFGKLKLLKSQRRKPQARRKNAAG